MGTKYKHIQGPEVGKRAGNTRRGSIVSAKYAMSYVRGVQGDSFEGEKLGQHLQALACCKHFTAYDLDNWKGVSRFVFDANVSNTLRPSCQNCISHLQCSKNLRLAPSRHYASFVVLIFYYSRPRLGSSCHPPEV